MAVLNDGLFEEWKREYETLVAELGPSEDLTQARGVTGSGFAQLGPKKVADFEAMGIEEIVNHLKSWQPDRQRGSFQKELTEFGWWFVSKRSNDDWSMDQLLEVLKITKTIDPDLWVVERLAELSVTTPRKTVQCLGLIVDGDEKGWGILGWNADARRVLAAALGSGDATAKQFAREVIHKLGGRGTTL